MELRECPACGSEAFDERGRVGCSNYLCVLVEGNDSEFGMSPESWNALPRRSDLEEACEIIEEFLGDKEPWPNLKPLARAFLAKHKK